MVEGFEQKVTKTTKTWLRGNTCAEDERRLGRSVSGKL